MICSYRFGLRGYRCGRYFCVALEFNRRGSGGWPGGLRGATSGRYAGSTALRATSRVRPWGPFSRRLT